MSKKFDVIVVGAGFGGPVAAKKCAEAGLKTLMLERSASVGDKVISGLTIPFYGFLFGPSFIRDGNPPFERPADGIKNYIIKNIDTGDIDIDDSLKIPKPFSPIIAFGYNAYCKPFIEWETKKAVDAGVILRTSTTAVNAIREKGCIKGIITDQGESIRSKIVIDAEGSQGLLAIKAGVRDKYPPETISLADIYDYEMPKKDIDKIFGHTLRFCWGWDEQRIAPPLGHGNGLMVWPYRNSIHFMQDQCLKMNNNKVPNLKKLFKEYHTNITTKLPWWNNDIAPHAKLRARMWQGFEVYVGLTKELRNMSNYTDGMILIGDAAGLEGTELCEGVPSAWISAEIAADIAIQAIKDNDVSESYLKKYDEAIKAHPLIQWSISGTNRYNLRKAQEKHDEDMLKMYVHNAWGLGALTHFTSPLVKVFLLFLRKDKAIVSKWMKMYFRYYQNWLYQSYDYTVNRKRKFKLLNRSNISEYAFRLSLHLLDSITNFVINNLFIRCFLKKLGFSVEIINPLLCKLLPKFEPILLKIIKILEPFTELLSKKLISFVYNANPRIFEITIRG